MCYIYLRCFLISFMHFLQSSHLSRISEALVSSSSAVSHRLFAVLLFLLFLLFLPFLRVMICFPFTYFGSLPALISTHCFFASPITSFTPAGLPAFFRSAISALIRPIHEISFLDIIYYNAIFNVVLMLY